MSHIYITNNGSVLSVDGGRFVVKQKNEIVTGIPKETVESISIFGNSSITTKCTQELLSAGIPVCYFSSRGRYFGRLESSYSNKVIQMHKQFQTFANHEYALGLSRKIVMAKINNQIVVLRRYTGSCSLYDDNIEFMKKMKVKAANGLGNEEIMGFEGMAARTYFKTISEFINPEFKFYERNRRPPKDPFNALLSLGYTLLLHEIIPKLQVEGLNPYLGVLHQMRNGNPSLANDLIEEWRAVLVDSTVLSMIQGKEISPDDFESDDNYEGIFLTNDGLRKFVGKFERKLSAKNKYLSYDDKQYSFREAISVQCKKLMQSIEEKDFDVYAPILIR